MTLTWAASDESTIKAKITYKVLYSLSDNITNVADAEANGTILQDWTINLLTADMTSLTSGTTYYAAVLARDEEGNTGISSGSATTAALPCVGKIMFLATVTNGSFGGVSSADTVCKRSLRLEVREHMGR